MRSPVILLIVTTLSVGTARADCFRPTLGKTVFQQSDLVFVDKVVSAKDVSPMPDDGASFGTSYLRSDVQQFRGEPKRTVLIFSGNDGGRFETPVRG